MNGIVENLKNFFAPLSTAQRALFVGLVLTIIVFIGGLFYWALQPNYSLLFGSLQDGAAQQVIKKLDDQGINYELKNGGHAIYVSKDKVEELRVQMAPIAAPKSDQKGYELFDSNSLGMTDFMQQLDKKRALEGELAKSISSLKQVESSRVHLVMPERSPFKQTSVKASASVLVALKQGQDLTKDQVEGITALIAGAVEGLRKDAITIIDQTGKRLTNSKQEPSDIAEVDNWMKSEQKTEQYLTQRGQSMLDRVLGPGNSIVRVSVDQDFDSLVRKSNKVDPESRTLISEKRSQETNSNKGSNMVPVDKFTPVNQRGKTAVTSNKKDQVSSRTRNYDVTKTNEVYKKAKGKISKLTASVIINYKQVLKKNKQGEMVWQSEPHSKKEIQDFKSALSLALGIQPSRGDKITIEQIKFWDPSQMSQSDTLNNPWPWGQMVRWGLILLTLLAVVALLNSLRKRVGSGSSELLLGYNGKGGQIFLGSQGYEGIGKSAKDELQELINEKNSDTPALEEKKYDLEEIVNLVDVKPEKAAKVVRAMIISNDNNK
ncbi:MAG TPA: flagellar basal-body MS-ring/collar protein FliF [Bacteroidales bacterium]|nr:flagellar basal-body MS-ring/collar protein FliF [Bacteroidales bacterium]